MSDSHLLNTIRMLKRAHQKLLDLYTFGAGPTGEAAQDAFDDEFDQLLDVESTHPLFDELMEECFKRGLQKELNSLRSQELLSFCTKALGSKK